MIAANYYSLLYLLAGALVVAIPGLTPGRRVALALVWIYLLPPLLARLILAVGGWPIGRATPDTRVYKTWWLLTQVQMIFNRVGLLEELLRLLPGVYSLWLTLWGSRASVLAYWSPGVLVTDRYLVRVSRGAVLGARSLIGGHVVTRNEAGDYELIAAAVTIGEGSIVGTLVAIGPGCVVHARETVPAGRRLPPFTAWKGGRKTALEESPVRP